MFHIVFHPRDTEVLNAAMDMDEALDGELVCLSDNYALGPIADLSTVEGAVLRRQWWLELSVQPADNDPLTADHANIGAMINRMREEEFDRIWIWVAPNARDLSGYYFLIGQLKEFAGRVDIISLNNLPFINDKGAVFYPATLAEIPPREFIKAKKLARPVSLAEFETDPDEWTRLAGENKNLRLPEGAKKLVQQEEDFFDAPLKKFITADFQKPARIIHQFLSKTSTKTDEIFLQWRLKKLVAAGEIEQQGETIRIPGAALVPDTAGATGQ
ncbi:MAG TPA: DUF3658 domain-containing protein [Puia sp.]|nr:DUF3658 domain-containing protein [Puia sp.]